MTYQHITSGPSTTKYDRYFVIVLLISLLLGLSFGASYGTDDNHPVYLIKGLMLADPSFLSNDWWARSTTHYHLLFAWLVAGLQSLGALPITLVVGNIVATAATAVTAYYILNDIRGRRSFDVWAVFLLLFFGMAQTKSVMETYLFGSSAEPSTIGTIGFMFALFFFLKERYAWSGASIALSGMFHANFLTLAFPVFGLAHIFIGGQALFKRVISQFLLPIIALAIQLPMIIDVMGLEVSPEIHRRAAYIFFNVAVPFHYLPNQHLLDFVPLAAWIILALPYAYRMRRHNDFGARVFSFYMSLILLLTLATALTTLVFIEPISRLFVWRLAPFALMLAYMHLAILFVDALSDEPPLAGYREHWLEIVLYAIGCVMLLRYAWYFEKTLWTVLILIGALGIAALRVSRRIPRTMRSDTVKLALKSASPVIGGLALVALALLQWNAAQNNIQRFSLICDSCTDRLEQQLYAWSRRTEEGAVFAIPPRLEGFRLFAKRAVVADYKALPFRADELVEWHDRMIDLCGAGASYSRRDMEDGYGDATRARIDKLSKKYGVGYVVARKGTSASGLDYPTAFENEKFRVLLVK